MLSSVTLNYQVTKNVMNSVLQLSELYQSKIVTILTSKGFYVHLCCKQAFWGFWGLVYIDKWSYFDSGTQNAIFSTLKMDNTGCFGHFGCTKNGISGAGIKILTPLFNQNHQIFPGPTDSPDPLDTSDLSKSPKPPDMPDLPRSTRSIRFS